MHHRIHDYPRLNKKHRHDNTQVTIEEKQRLSPAMYRNATDAHNAQKQEITPRNLQQFNIRQLQNIDSLIRNGEKFQTLGNEAGVSCNSRKVSEL